MHILERHQLVPGGLDDVYAFFEDPHNLETITPSWLHFRVTAASDARMRLGTVIDYRLRWQVVPMRWRSLIAEHEPPVRFADQMLVGPYRRWYHRHVFTEVPGGVEMLDIVEYELPFGGLGTLAHAALVRRQLDAIFDYRSATIARLFGEHRGRPTGARD